MGVFQKCANTLAFAKGRHRALVERPETNPVVACEALFGPKPQVTISGLLNGAYGILREAILNSPYVMDQLCYGLIGIQWRVSDLGRSGRCAAHKDSDEQKDHATDRGGPGGYSYHVELEVRPK